MKRQPSPLISIVMPSYQQVAFVEEAVRSVLDQEDVAAFVLERDDAERRADRRNGHRPHRTP